MTWVNLDDQMPEHPKVAVLSDGAFRLHLSAIFYCNRHLTDGVVHATIVPRLMPRYRKNYLDELLTVTGTNGDEPLWIPHGNSYEIHDYLDWNKSRADVQGHRARVSKVRAEAGRKGAAARWQT